MKDQRQMISDFGQISSTARGSSLHFRDEVLRNSRAVTCLSGNLFTTQLVREGSIQLVQPRRCLTRNEIKDRFVWEGGVTGCADICTRRAACERGSVSTSSNAAVSDPEADQTLACLRGGVTACTDICTRITPDSRN